jgi:antitoxin component YwqK of YwqJK toxin-antitoxin module
MNYTRLFAFTVGLLFIGTLVAQTRKEVADFAIPADAVRGRLGHGKEDRVTYQNFFAAGADLSKREVVPVIAREEFYDGHLVKRQLFRNGKNHGVWRTWHPNGQLASEEPYCDGVMDGLFRHWDESGKLIAQYIIRSGNGTRRIYDTKGRLIREVEFVNSMPNGISMTYDEQFSDRTIVWKKNGAVVGNAFSFYPDGSLKGITSYSAIGASNGPSVDFSAGGAVLRKEWYLRKKQVDESTYAAAAAKDPSLPVYYVNAADYKKWVVGPIKEALDHYQAMPRVKIPLEFDEHGNPVVVRQSR